MAENPGVRNIITNTTAGLRPRQIRLTLNRSRTGHGIGAITRRTNMETAYYTPSRDRGHDTQTIPRI